MRKISLLFIVAAMIGFSCTKTDPNNPFSSYSNFTIGSYLTVAELGNTFLNTTDLPGSVVSIKVGSVGAEVAQVKLYVTNGNASDASTWVLLKTVDYTGEGTELSSNGQEIADALGITPQPGDSYTMIDQLIAKDGRTFDLTNISPAIEGIPEYNMAFRWTVSAVCPFDAAASAGDYMIIADGWADWSPGDIIPNAIEAGPGANQLTLHVYPSPYYGTPINPIIIDVDPATGAATVPDVLYGDYGYLAACSGSGLVFSCIGKIILTLDHHAPGGSSYGVYTLEIQKQ
jgi:hypothetical protein